MDRLGAMQVFVRVVETGSFSKAAAEFQTTQPTVTKQVAALEARLKVDRKSTRLNSSHSTLSRMPSSA